MDVVRNVKMGTSLCLKAVAASCVLLASCGCVHSGVHRVAFEMVPLAARPLRQLGCNGSWLDNAKMVVFFALAHHNPPNADAKPGKTSLGKVPDIGGRVPLLLDQVSSAQQPRPGWRDRQTAKTGSIRSVPLLERSIRAQNAGQASTMPRAKVYCCGLLWLR